MLANEMDDEDCTREIVDGDIHTIIWELIDDFSASRGNTKSVEYAMIYGGADEKLGSLADVEGCREQFASEEKLGLRGWEKDGNMWRHTRWHPNKESLTLKQAQDTVCGGIMRDRIMKGLKPLGDCIDRITKQAEKGYLVGLDGRKLKVRSSHSALNLKLQSTGAILMKTAMVTLMEKYEKRGLMKIGKEYVPNKYVELFTFYHDEYQLGIPKHTVTDEKVMEFDLSEYDLDDKSQKKAAKEFVEKAVARFHNRQRRRENKIWSGPVIDLKAGTATLKYSIVGQLCVETFEETGIEFGINCEVTGDYLVGMSWRDCH